MKYKEIKKKTQVFVVIAGLILSGIGCSDSIDKIMVQSSDGFKYRIDAMKCFQCGVCYDVCPRNAIEEKKVDGKFIYIINTDLCDLCGDCIKECPNGGIQKVER